MILASHSTFTLLHPFDYFSIAQQLPQLAQTPDFTQSGPAVMTGARDPVTRSALGKAGGMGTATRDRQEGEPSSPSVMVDGQ